MGLLKVIVRPECMNEKEQSWLMESRLEAKQNWKLFRVNWRAQLHKSINQKASKNADSGAPEAAFVSQSVSPSVSQSRPENTVNRNSERQQNRTGGFGSGQVENFESKMLFGIRNVIFSRPNSVRLFPSDL